MDENHFHNLRKLNSLSTTMNEVLRDIMQLAYAQAHQLPWIAPDSSQLDVRLMDSNLWIDRIMIPLGTRPRTLCLMQAFFKNGGRGLSKAEIVEAVYGVQVDRSLRFMEAQDQSLTKLLSRTRSYLELSLAQAYPNRPIEWLVFDAKTRRYHLYEIRSYGPETLKPAIR